MELKTPLYNMHTKSGGKMVSFAGYMLPIEYQTGIVKEHMAVRTKCGLFDVSHMGEIILTGPDALENLQNILTNDFTNMNNGQARYSLMCYENGGVVDDLIVYKYSDNKYFIVVNASNKEKDFKWMKSHQSGNAEFIDISERVAQIALQGPLANAILSELTNPKFIPKKYYTGIFDARIEGIKCLISKTGYTGEDGYEIYMSPENAPRIWEMLMDKGAKYGLIPCGLGARDTLRMEAAMPLYGHELSESITPLEAGLNFAVKMGKKDFIGKKALESYGAPKRKRVGIKAIGKGILREGYNVLNDGKVIGKVTSGTLCPYIGMPIAMALIDESYAKEGTLLMVPVRGREIEAVIVALPFYKK